ncbi:MAG: hypothetical protein C0623_13120 [Desulfuromonas sp.]|nr:MAG: hypothetical protein C0623_13120 [Desulfuromonas sp.]
MDRLQPSISSTRIPLPRHDLADMIRLVRALFRLSRLPDYRQSVWPLVPEIARFNPGHDAVMMGYDFHLSENGPQLIEVNNNAGGGLLAYLAYQPDDNLAYGRLPERLREQLVFSFAEEMRRFTGGDKTLPRRIAIIDENPEKQFLYPEMEIFRDLFADWCSCCATIVDPGELEASARGVFIKGMPVDLIYNRHCDFYLETEVMSGIRDAYRNGTVCLTPNPFTYGLLADKRRLASWTNPDRLRETGLDERSREIILRMIPESHIMSDMDLDQLWSERKQWVLKPAVLHASRGVLLGASISRKRFNEFVPEETVVQRFVPPNRTETADGSMKTDFRLFVYRRRVLGVSARLFQGQVTNLRTEGGGFAAVDLI